MPSSSSSSSAAVDDHNDDEPDVIVERQSGLFHYVYSSKNNDDDDDDYDETTNVNKLEYHYIVGRQIGIGIGQQQQHHRNGNDDDDDDGSGVRICRHKRTGQKRAMKILSKRYVTPQKFHEEMKALRKVDHPNLLRLYESFEDDYYYYIITELSTAGNLYDYLTQHYQTLTEIDFARLMKTILICVNHCHALNIIHCDIKPENILMEKEDYKDPSSSSCSSAKSYDRLILADFGFSQFYDNNNNNNNNNNDNPPPEKQQQQQRRLNRLVGTKEFWAPEVFRRNYSAPADIWSCGILAFVLLTGEFPFRGTSSSEVKNAKEIYQQICKLQQQHDGTTDHCYLFDLEVWNIRTPEGKAFVQQLLSFNEMERPTAQEALQHPWFDLINNNSEVDIESIMAAQQQPPPPPLLPALERLITFSAKQKLKQATYSYLVAHRINKKRRKILDKIFRVVDTNSDGMLSKQEIEIAFRKEQQQQQAKKGGGFGTTKGFISSAAVVPVMTTDELNYIFQRLDIDQNGYINYWEFLSATIRSDSLLCDENLRLAFDAFDRNNSGTITAEEVKELFFANQQQFQSVTAAATTKIEGDKEGCSGGGGGGDDDDREDDKDEEGGSNSSSSDINEIITSIIKQVDENGDGVISYEEFEKMMQENLLSSVLSHKRLRSSDESDRSNEYVAPPRQSQRQRSC